MIHIGIVIDMEKRELIESGLLEAYVLGLCSDEEAEVVEKMAHEHPDLGGLIKEMKSGMLDYCHGAQKSNSAVGRSPLEEGGMAHKKSIWRIIGPAATVVAILAIVALINQSSQFYGLEHDLAMALDEKHDIKERLNSLLQEQDQTHAQINFLQDLHTHHILLSDAKRSSHARAIAYWNTHDQRAFLHVLDLPAPPQDMTYRLWAEVNGGMMDMGMLHDHRGQWISLPFMHKAERIHLTMEPNGQMDASTVDKVVAVGIVQ